MHLLKKGFFLAVLLQFACSSGGPLTPVDSFTAIKSAVDKNDSEAITDYLTESSLEKINRLNVMIKDMRSDQLDTLSAKYGYSQDKLRNLKISDSVSLYFFSEATGVKLGRYFKENIVSSDIHGDTALIRTDSGIELDFKREGPYWKFDLSEL